MEPDFCPILVQLGIFKEWLKDTNCKTCFKCFDHLRRVDQGIIFEFL